MTLSQISLAEYNNIPAVRQSNLKKIGVSPLHYKHTLERGTGMSPAMIVGDATHAAVLEPHRFEREYVTYPGPTRRGKAWDEFKLMHPGATFITARERAKCQAIGAAIRSNPQAMHFLKEGKSEVTMQWTDKETGLPCKARIDFLGQFLVGLKTARNIGPEGFGAQSARLGYELQWAFYESGMRTVTGSCPPLIEIAAENEAPWDVIPYFIDEEVLDVGRDMMRRYMRLLADCTAAGKWPGQGGGQTLPLKLPAWAAGFVPEEDPVIDYGDKE